MSKITTSELAAMRQRCERVTEYLQLGGLFNPELANHEAVRDMLIDFRNDQKLLLDALEHAGREKEAAVRAAVDRAWKIVEDMTDNDYFNQDQVYALHKAAAAIRKGGAE